MSEMVGAAIVGEAVSRAFSGVISKYVNNSDERGNLERLEMAHIKMEAAVEISSKWQITDVSLIRWRRKLKRASLECNHAMRECKRRSQEDKRFQDQVKQSSFPRRVAYATKSFMSLVSQKNDEFPSKATVRRFERLADGANDFLRYIQLGGTPRQYTFFDPLITHLFAGKFVQYEMWHHSQYHYFGIWPMSSEERGLEVMLAYVYEDQKIPNNSFHLGSILRLSESMNIIGITIKCLQLVTPHFKSTAEVAIKKLIELPTQDFFWLPCNAYGNMEHCNHVQNTLARCLRSDPLCCQGYDLPNMPPGCSIWNRNASRLSVIFPEPVSHVFLQGLIPLTDYKSLGSTTRCILMLGLLFAPHDSVEDWKSAVGVESCVTETIDGEKQQCTHIDAHPQQLDEMLLPKAIKYLSQNAGATTYQISWNSTHGSAHLCVEKINVQCRATPQGEKKSELFKLQDRLNKGHWRQVARNYLKTWGLHSRSLDC